MGRHVLAEFFDCDPNILNNKDRIENNMVDAAIECGATVVQKCFHMFSPFGVSGVVIIAESHLSVHTWPELGYAAVDLFTCGNKCDPKVAYEFLKKKFNSKNASFTQLNRGILNRETMQLTHKTFELAQQIES
ncbi:MAG: adenosylmethionine decarboxylase [Candidatus Gastranaerophilaceae bacterium]